jgi:polar amino acid transport system substrate-binding protein
LIHGLLLELSNAILGLPEKTMQISSAKRHAATVEPIPASPIGWPGTQMMQRNPYIAWRSWPFVDSVLSFFSGIANKKRWIPVAGIVIVLAIVVILLIQNLVPQKIRVAVDASWPPFESLQPANKEITGFDIDLMNAIAKKANMKVEYVNVGFDQIMSGLAECKYDAAISLIAVTDKRKSTMLFSDSYFQLGQVLTVLSTNIDIKGSNSLSGKKVGAQIGTAGASEVGKIAGTMLITYDSIDQAFTALENGELDAVAADNTLALNFIGQSAGKLKSAGEVFAGKDIAIAVCKKDSSLLGRINRGLAAVKKEGMIDTLIGRWLMKPA